MYISCPPCACQIQTALAICQGNGVSPLLEVSICIDYRLPSSCVRSGQALYRLISIERKIKNITTDHADLPTVPKGNSIDCPWLERRSFQLEQGASESSFAEDPSGVVLDMIRNAEVCRSTTGMVISGEMDCFNSMLEDVFMTRSPRKPRETDLYELISTWDPVHRVYNWRHHYMGAYSRAKKFAAMQNVIPAPAIL